MTTFPAHCPHSRQYTLGGEPVAFSELQAFRLGTEPVSLGLTLTWTAITPAVADSINVTHYQGQRGSTRPFDLPEEIWLDHESPNDVLPLGQQWRYAPGSPPEQSPQSGGLVDLTVNLISYIS